MAVGALAAGSILYVVIELLAVGRKLALQHTTGWGNLLGLALGLATDAIVNAAGTPKPPPPAVTAVIRPSRGR